MIHNMTHGGWCDDIRGMIRQQMGCDAMMDGRRWQMMAGERWCDARWRWLWQLLCEMQWCCFVERWQALQQLVWSVCLLAHTSISGMVRDLHWTCEGAYSMYLHKTCSSKSRDRHKVQDNRQQHTADTMKSTMPLLRKRNKHECCWPWVTVPSV